ncbi:MAG: hypothetical protein ABR508_08705 [Candidatus Baltobacteraceae bacterium]
MRWKPLTAIAGAACALYALFVVLVVFLAFWRPPQPLPLGTVQWVQEAGATVDSVERVARITDGKRIAVARGQFYIVHARVLAPLGLRPHWSDDDVEVRTFSGSGGSMRGLRFGVDEAAQRILDRRTGRPGPHHVIIGASQHEDLVFDLPRNVEQPGILFLAANDPAQLLELIFGRVWQPHRFNLRYD